MFPPSPRTENGENGNLWLLRRLVLSSSSFLFSDVLPCPVPSSFSKNDSDDSTRTTTATGLVERIRWKINKKISPKEKFWNFPVLQNHKFISLLHLLLLVGYRDFPLSVYCNSMCVHLNRRMMMVDYWLEKSIRYLLSLSHSYSLFHPLCTCVWKIKPSQKQNHGGGGEGWFYLQKPPPPYKNHSKKNEIKKKKKQQKPGARKEDKPNGEWVREST